MLWRGWTLAEQGALDEGNCTTSTKGLTTWRAIRDRAGAAAPSCYVGRSSINEQDGLKRGWVHAGPGACDCHTQKYGSVFTKRRCNRFSGRVALLSMTLSCGSIKLKLKDAFCRP